MLHPSTDRFGVREAFCFSNAADEWIRLSRVARSSRAVSAGDILDVGAGLTSFSSLLPEVNTRVVLVDTRFRGVKAELGRSRERVRADATRLPFRSSAFAIVASVDMLEHIPRSKRATALSELLRVSTRHIIIHCPAVSGDERFIGREDDEDMDAWLRQHFDAGDVNLDEHLSSGHPSVEELLTAFPGALVTGTQDSAAWRELMRASRLPFLGLFASFRYKDLIARGPQGGPYHSCLVEWTKP